MKNILFTLIFGFLSSFIFCQIDTINFEFDVVRELSELNDPGSGEGYPWISDDGLRIYFTTYLFSVSVSVLSQKEHIDSLFSEPIALTINSDSTNNNSPWLTKDELDIYFVSGVAEILNQTKLYHASREDINDEFDAPVEVILNGANEGFYSSPSFTEDLEQVFIFNANGTNRDTVFHFEKSDDNEYNIVDALPTPIGYIPGPGKLSKNGLRYFLSMSNSAGFGKKMYVAEREDLDSTFDSFYFIDNEFINSSGSQNIQPSLSRNGRFMVFTRNDGQTWSANDLFIAYNYEPVSVNENELNERFIIKISPNPASDFIRFEIVNDDQSYKNLDLVIYSSDGRVIDETSFKSQNNNMYLSTTEYNSGMYFFKVKSDKGDFASGSFIMKSFKNAGLNRA